MHKSTNQLLDITETSSNWNNFTTINDDTPTILWDMPYVGTKEEHHIRTLNKKQKRCLTNSKTKYEPRALKTSCLQPTNPMSPMSLSGTGCNSWHIGKQTKYLKNEPMYMSTQTKIVQLSAIFTHVMTVNSKHRKKQRELVLQNIKIINYACNWNVNKSWSWWPTASAETVVRFLFFMTHL